MRSVIKQRTKELVGEKLYRQLRSYKQRGLLVVRFGFSPTLAEIGKFHQTDKSDETHTFSGLSYMDIYEKYLDQLRSKRISLLEIGVKDAASLRTWKSYFKKGDIYGIDIDPKCKALEEERIHVEIGSQDDGDFLRSCFGPDKKFDVILDDGSHVNKMTLASFEYLFGTRLKKGGTYIMEDLHCSYDKLQSDFNVLETWPGMMYNDPLKLYDNDRNDMNTFFLGKIRDLDHLQGDILSIHFWAMTCVITKV